MIDPKKAIHLIHGHSGRGTLTYYFRTYLPNDKIQIQGIYSTFSVGPLSDFISSSDYEEYVAYWKSLNPLNVFNSTDDEQLHYHFNSSLIVNQFKINFSKKKPLIIWHGSEVDEKLMLYRYCHLLKDRDLYEINLDEWPMNPEDNYYISNCLATRRPEDLDGIFNIVKKIDRDSKTLYAEEWERLKKDQKTSRILQNGKVISVEEEYYDQDLLNNCTSEFQNAAKVIGKTMGQQKSTVGDHYLLCRIYVLINQNLLDWKGNLKAIRSFEIRKK